MGMAMEIFAVRNVTLQRLLTDPPLVWRLIAPDEPEMYEEARAEAERGVSRFVSRLFGGKPKQPAAADEGPLQLSEGEGLVADLDKAWHGLHFLLTGTAEAGYPPLDFLVDGGDAVGDVDVGYGPARALRPTLVIEIAAQLANLSDAALSARYDGAAMTAQEIYPDIWERDSEEDDSRAYLLENLVVLRKAVAEAADRHLGLILVLH